MTGETGRYTCPSLGLAEELSQALGSGSYERTASYKLEVLLDGNPAATKTFTVAG